MRRAWQPDAAAGETGAMSSTTPSASAVTPGEAVDSSEAPDSSETQGTEPWWQSAVVYQVYPRSFADASGDGVGDIPGIRQHLDHLEALGVDVVWLSPIYRSPQDDNGYDISDYQDVDPMFGTLADLDGLIADLHDRGMRLVMDLVVNHTSDEHPWFVESRSSIDSPKRDWYWWRKPREGHAAGDDGAEPTNWGAAFSGSAWALDEASGEYFLHLFSPKQPDLNWENPEVRQAVYDMMLWWLDRGVDGFRMDVINMISKDPSLPDGEPMPGEAYASGGPFFLNGPRIHEFLREMHERVFDQRPGTYLTVGEMPGCSVDDARLYTDPARHELEMVFQFEHVDLDHGPGGKWDPGVATPLDLKRSFGRWQTGLGDVGWNSLYWNNHDQPRVVSRFGDDGRWRTRSATALATVLHLQKGTPYVYQGEELGMANAPFTDIAQYRDIETLNHIRTASASAGDTERLIARARRISRDNARTPVQWTGDDGGGFSDAVPWIEMNPDHVEVNAAAQVEVAGSVFEFYRMLVRLRHDDHVVRQGVFELVIPDDPAVFAYTRTGDGRQLLVLVNLSGDRVGAAAVPHDDLWRAAGVLVDNAPDEPDDDLLSLAPWQARVLERALA